MQKSSKAIAAAAGGAATWSHRPAVHVQGHAMVRLRRAKRHHDAAAGGGDVCGPGKPLTPDRVRPASHPHLTTRMA